MHKPPCVHCSTLTFSTIPIPMRMSVFGEFKTPEQLHVASSGEHKMSRNNVHPWRQGPLISYYVDLKSSPNDSVFLRFHNHMHSVVLKPEIIQPPIVFFGYRWRSCKSTTLTAVSFYGTDDCVFLGTVGGHVNPQP